jgi:hypothetical protein
LHSLWAAELCSCLQQPLVTSLNDSVDSGYGPGFVA